jgi:hypothetical protein
MRRGRIVLAMLAGAALLLYLGNASSLVSSPSAHPSLLAHRAVTLAMAQSVYRSLYCAAAAFGTNRTRKPPIT